MPGCTLTREAAAVTSASRMRLVTSTSSRKTRLPSGAGSSRMRVLGRQPAQLFPIVEVAVGLDGLEREGAIHGAGLQVQQPEAGGDARRDRALAGAGRAVDGDHQRRAVVGCHAPGFFLSGLRPRKLAGGLPGFPPGFGLPARIAVPARGQDLGGRDPGRTAASAVAADPACLPEPEFAPDFA